MRPSGSGMLPSTEWIFAASSKYSKAAYSRWPITGAIMANRAFGASERSAAAFMSSSIHCAVKTVASSALGKQMPESKERITRVTLEEAKRLKDETDYARL